MHWNSYAHPNDVGVLIFFSTCSIARKYFCSTCGSVFFEYTHILIQCFFFSSQPNKRLRQQGPVIFSVGTLPPLLATCWTQDLVQSIINFEIRKNPPISIACCLVAARNCHTSHYHIGVQDRCSASSSFGWTGAGVQDRCIFRLGGILRVVILLHGV